LELLAIWNGVNVTKARARSRKGRVFVKADVSLGVYRFFFDALSTITKQLLRIAQQRNSMQKTKRPKATTHKFQPPANLKRKTKYNKKTKLIQ
jgi:hypothetical protein